MKKTIKVTWESFSEGGQRFVRERYGEHEAILGPLHMSFAWTIDKRQELIERGIWLAIRHGREQDEAEKSRNEALARYLGKSAGTAG